MIDRQTFTSGNSVEVYFHIQFTTIVRQAWYNRIRFWLSKERE